MKRTVLRPGSLGQNRPRHTVLLLAALLMWPALGRAGVLYFADIFNPDFETGAVKRVNTDATGLEPLVDVGGGLRAIAVDPAGGKIYWTDVNSFAIRRSNLDGSDVEDLVTSGLEFPAAIALDTQGGKMYWGDQTANEVRRANLDGTENELVRSTAFHRGIAVDPAAGKVYWSTSLSANKGDIVRSNFDGTELETVVTSLDALFKPAAIALDSAGGKVYWTDYTVDVVRRANLDGSGVEDLYVVGDNLNPRGITLDLSEGRVYWGQDADPKSPIGKIMRAYTNGDVAKELVLGLGLVNSLAFVESAPPTVTITGANPPLDHPLLAGEQPFRDVLQTGTGASLVQGIGATGTPDQDTIVYSSISVTFSGTPDPLPTPFNTSVTCTDISGTGISDCPMVTSMVGADAGPYVFTLSTPIPTRECTTITFAGATTGQKVQYQSLPGDINLNGTVSNADLLALVVAINNGDAAMPANLPRYNINRVQTVTASDVLRLVQLLNGVNAPQSFLGKTVAACPD